MAEKMELVYVEWLDSFGVSSSWQPMDDIGDVKPVVCVSVGFLAKETDDCIVIVPHAYVDAEGGQAGCGDMCIPKVAIIYKDSACPLQPSLRYWPEKKG